MKVYIVVELFKGGIKPEIRGVYTDKTKAEEIKSNYRFAFIDEQNLIQSQAEKVQTEEGSPISKFMERVRYCSSNGNIKENIECTQNCWSI